MIRTVLALLLLAGSITIQAESLDLEYRVVEQWTAADGLPADTVSRLAVDKQGYLWMATYDGVVRHQGFDFHTFTRENEPALPSNRSREVLTAPEDGMIVHFENKQLGHLSAQGYQPIGRAEYSNVAVWNGYVWFIDAQTQRLQSWDSVGGLQQRSTTNLTKLAVDLFNERLLLGAGDGSVLALSMLDKTRVGLVRVGSAAPDPIVGLAGGPNGETLILSTRSAILVAADSDDLQTIHLATWENAQPALLRATWTTTGWLIANLITDTGAGPNKLLASGTQALPLEEVTSVDADRSPASILRIDTHDRRWINDGHRLFRDGQLMFQSEDRIYDFIVDPFDQIWITQPGQGLKLLKRSIIKVIGQGPNGLPDPNISMVTEIDGDILVGSWVALSRFNPTTGNWQHLLDRAALDVLPDSDSLLVTNDGVCRLTGPGECLKVSDFPVPLAEVYQLHRDATGAVWAGTNAGLFRRSPDGIWERRLIHPSTARVALEEDSGRLILGTNGDGLLVLSIHDHPGFSVTQLGYEIGLPSQFIRSLLDVSDGRILVGTEDAGLCLLDSNLSIVSCLSTSDGLPHHSVHYMVVDPLNRMWVNTNAGIYRVDLAELLAYIEGRHGQPPVFTRFGERQGLLSIEGNGGVHRAGTQTSDGRIWFPNQKGLVVIQTGAETAPMPIALKPKIRVQGQQITDSLRLDATARQVELEILTTALARPEDVEFRYRLGPSTDWFMLGKQRRITLTNLPPGSRKIEFQARYPELDWNGPSTILNLDIGYLAHEHPVTKTVFLLLAIAGLTGFWMAMRHRQRALERKVKKRSLQLDQASAQVIKLNDSMQRIDLRHRTALKAVSNELKGVLDAAMLPLLDRLDLSSSESELSDIQEKARTLGGLVEQVKAFSEGPQQPHKAEPAFQTDHDSDIASNSPEPTAIEPKDSEDLERRIRLEVLLHLGDPDFSVEKLSANLAMSRSVLYRRVAEFSNFSPAELIRDLRLEQASQLLLESNERISTIGDATGFRDVSTFSRAFSKKMGMSPRQWRKHQAQKSSTAND